MLIDRVGAYAVAIVPYVKVRIAAHNFGNNHWKSGGSMTFIATPPYGRKLNITNEADTLENSALNGYHTNYSELINIRHYFFDDSVTGYVGFWGEAPNDKDATTRCTTDLMLAWIASNNLQIEPSNNIGLNNAAIDLQAYFKISHRF